MAVRLEIDQIDWSNTGAQIFQRVANANLAALNWSRTDGTVEYLRTEADPNYPGKENIWIKVDAYPDFEDTDPLVVKNGRFYEMSITVDEGSVVLPDDEPVGV